VVVVAVIAALFLIPGSIFRKGSSIRKK
jgi:hypothetical protein